MVVCSLFPLCTPERTVLVRSRVKCCQCYRLIREQETGSRVFRWNWPVRWGKGDASASAIPRQRCRRESGTRSIRLECSCGLPLPNRALMVGAEPMSAMRGIRCAGVTHEVYQSSVFILFAWQTIRVNPLLKEFSSVWIRIPNRTREFRRGEHKVLPLP